MTKTTPEIEARIELASRLRQEARERREQNPPRRYDVSVFKAKRERRRERFRNAAAHGTLPRNRTNELAEAFSGDELRELLIEDAAGKERRAESSERRRQHREVKRLSGQVERERAAEERADAEREARERLGLD